MGIGGRFGMTQEERKLKRKRDTKNAILLIMGMLCMVIALGVGGVLLAGKVLEKQENLLFLQEKLVIVQSQNWLINKLKSILQMLKH